jgi:F-type H+-transporting ATPase subunit delta
MKGTKAAGRYAQALLELALEKNNVDQVLADLKYLLEVNEQFVEFQLLLKSPIVNSDKKIAIFKELFGQFEDLSSSFVTMIIKKGRDKDLPLIAEKFIELVKESRGIVSVTLTTAVKADDSTKKAIFDKLEKKYEGTFDITEKIDASLIGGFIVRIGDDQIDASVASQLNNLKQCLTR